MLAYLDALIDALSVRDRAGIMRLLDHPLARILPAEARAEAEAFAGGERDPLAAPLRVMQLRHQTSELLRDAPIVADRVEEPGAVQAPSSAPSSAPRPPAMLQRRAPRLVQMELPLSA